MSETIDYILSILVYISILITNALWFIYSISYILLPIIIIFKSKKENINTSILFSLFVFIIGHFSIVKAILTLSILDNIVDYVNTVADGR